MKLTGWFDIERLIHSFKTLIACLFGILLTRLLNFPADQWIVITILVLMCSQIYVGSVIQKSYLRFLGTLVGCLFAMLTFLLFGDSLPIIMVSLCLSSFIFSYIAVSSEQFTYACTLGAVTTTLILLSPNPTITYSAERFLEISFGILIATLISQFVLPIQAKTHLRRTQAKTLKELRDYYQVCIIEQDENGVREKGYDENIVKLLSRQRQLAKDARREPFGKGFDHVKCVQLLEYEKEILRAIDFMHLAFAHMHHARHTIAKLSIWQAFNESIMGIFNRLITSITQQQPLQTIPSTELTMLKRALDSAMLTVKDEEKLYVSSLYFTVEMLTEYLQKLALLYRVTLSAPAKPITDQ